MDRQGNLADEIDIDVHGLPQVTNDGEEFDDVLYDSANGAIKSIPKKRRKDAQLIQKAVRQSVRATARDEWGKKPVTTVFVAVVK